MAHLGIELASLVLSAPLSNQLANRPLPVLTFISQASPKIQLHKDISKSRNVAQSNVQIVNYIELSSFAWFRRNVDIAVFPLKVLNIPWCLCKFVLWHRISERKLINTNSEVSQKKAMLDDVSQGSSD